MLYPENQFSWWFRKDCYGLFSDAKESRMFKDLPADLMSDLASESLTANAHLWSLAMSVCSFNFSCYVRLHVQHLSTTFLPDCFHVFNQMHPYFALFCNILKVKRSQIRRKFRIIVFFLRLFQSYNSNLELKKFYKVLSTNSDGSLEFVSTIEGGSTRTRHCCWLWARVP